MKRIMTAIVLCVLFAGCAKPVAEPSLPTSDTSEASSVQSSATSAATEQTFTEEPPMTSQPVQQTEEPVEQPPYISGSVTILGPNMVYTGEYFDFKYEFVPESDSEEAEFLWECIGDAGSIAADGRFTGTQKGTVTLRVYDSTESVINTLDVHVVDTAADVDFVPMVNGIPIANKTYPLPKDYDPGISSEAYDAYKALVSAAKSDGIDISFISGYRGYNYQKTVYENWCVKYPNGQADRISARPGHSEHQLGLAIDVNSLEFEFAETPEGIWLAENCYKYGFIIRYPEGKENITGYMYEPWHIRYLGTELAEKVHNSGLTLEEYLGIDSYYRGEYEYASDIPLDNPENS